MSKSAKSFTAWVGFSDGRPHFERSTDEYCGPAESFESADLFRSHAAARKRFQDVRKVRISVVTGRVTRRRSGKWIG